MITPDPRSGHTVLINTFTVDPARAEDLFSVLSRTTAEDMRRRPGFVSASLHMSDDKRYVASYAHWRQRSDVDIMMADPAAQACLREAASIALSFAPICYDVRETHSSEGAA